MERGDLTLLSNLPPHQKALYRQTLAAWASETITNQAERAVHDAFRQVGETCGNWNHEARHHELSVAHRTWLNKSIDETLLKSVTNDGEGDPNPILVTQWKDENLSANEKVRDLLRDYASELATLECASRDAAAQLKTGRWTSEEGLGLPVDKYFERKSARFAYDLGQRWSWKALKVYQEGVEESEGEGSDSEDEPDDDPQPEKESGEEGEEGKGHKRQRAD